MALTSRKKRPLDRRSKPSPDRDARLFIIATEGEKTEKQYFDMFGNRRCQVKVIPSSAGRSAPAHVLRNLTRFKKEHQLGKDDELWLMIDVDRWTEPNLSRVTKEALQKRFFLAVSNPCFELWLYLHIDDIGPKLLSGGKNMKDILRNKLGSFNPSNLDLTPYRETIGKAIRRARDLDVNPDERWPSSTGTHVYKVVEKVR